MGIGGRIFVAASWMAASFLSVLAMVAVAELIKLFVDIEHNTRAAATRYAAEPAVASQTPPPLPSNGSAPAAGRLPWLHNEETAEGALVRGH